MQPHHFAVTYLCSYPYTKKLNEEEITCSSYRVLCLYFLRRTYRQIRVEICEVVSFHYLRVRCVTLQELLANNMRSLIRDLKKSVNTRE